VLKTFDSPIFSGASIETDAYNIDTLLQFSDVASVWLNEKVELAPFAPTENVAESTALEYTTHNSTGVNKVHARGIFGEGVIVGVVDTGTWYDHPAVSLPRRQRRDQQPRPRIGS
jgi:hypothetical protein